MSESEIATLDDRAYERLSAYLDDEMSQEERRRFDAELAADPALAQALDDMRALGVELQAAFPLSDAPPIAAAPPRRRSIGRPRALGRTLRSRSRLPLAAAAAAALAVGFGVGAWRAPDTPPLDGVAAGQIAKDAALSEILETARIGDATPMGATDVVILGTFLTTDGAPCREFENLPRDEPTLTFGVACRSTDAAWRVVFAASAPKHEEPDGRITPASGPGLDAFDQLLDSLGAGPILSADEEARLIAAGWRQPG